jgi:hypothetical protein
MAAGFLSTAPCEFHVNGDCYNDRMLHKLKKIEGGTLGSQVVRAPAGERGIRVNK